MHPDSAHFGASLPRELPHAVREVVSLAMVAIWVKTNQKWSHQLYLTKPNLCPGQLTPTGTHLTFAKPN